MRFKTFLTEAVTGEEKLTHLEHAEDHPINAGEDGTRHALNTLHQTHQLLSGQKSDATVSTKLDGSPSIVFGTNPDNGRFFVASKSAFNATPKLNYTPEDVERNHGHAPGLVSKLKAALQHLPKVAPKQGVYQGDFMYHKDDGDVREHEGSYHFTPNTISYSTKKGSAEGQKIAKSKIGVAVHTAYSGSSLQGMKAEYNADLSGFREHDDVHLISPKIDHTKVRYPKAKQDEFKQHMQAAMDTVTKLKKYDHLDGHDIHLKTYINSTVRDGTTPTVDGYKEHIRKHFQKKADGLKTDAGKAGQMQKLQDHHAHIDKHSDKFANTLELHKHLQNAKNVLVNALASHTTYGHHVGGKEVKPEGHVAVINNRPTKLVDRDEFSRLNFAARPR